MPAELDWASIISFLCGGGGAAFCVNLFIKRAVDQLDEFTDKMESMTHKNIVMEGKLAAAENEIKTLRETVASHDRKIVELDVRSMKNRSMIRNKN